MQGVQGIIINISSWGSQHRVSFCPLSYHVSKACVDQTTAVLARSLSKLQISVIELWPGNFRREGQVLAMKSMGLRLGDAESTSFTGQAVVSLACSVRGISGKSGRTILSAAVAADFA
jgi:NAD(P)-dependent dehydrogenase (short-subunit alcohol dehydrogenase family)